MRLISLVIALSWGDSCGNREDQEHSEERYLFGFIPKSAVRSNTYSSPYLLPLPGLSPQKKYNEGGQVRRKVPFHSTCLMPHPLRKVRSEASDLPVV